jgi:hypothetical protein
MSQKFKNPIFTDGSIEFRFEDGEVALYGTREGFEKFIGLCQELIIRKAPDHLHLEDYEILTENSTKATIGIFE